MDTPKVLGFSKNCLLLEWIETSHNTNHQAEIGKVLANLHKRTKSIILDSIMTIPLGEYASI